MNKRSVFVLIVILFYSNYNFAQIPSSTQNDNDSISTPAGPAVDRASDLPKIDTTNLIVWGTNYPISIDEAEKMLYKLSFSIILYFLSLFMFMKSSSMLLQVRKEYKIAYHITFIALISLLILFIWLNVFHAIAIVRTGTSVCSLLSSFVFFITIINYIEVYFYLKANAIEQNKEYNFSIVSFILSVLGLVSSILTIITFYQSL